MDPFGLSDREVSDGALTALALIEAMLEHDPRAGSALLDACSGEDALAVVLGLAALAGLDLLGDLASLGIDAREWIAARRSALMCDAAQAVSPPGGSGAG